MRWFPRFAAMAGVLGLLARLEIVSNPAIRIDAGVVLLLVASAWVVTRDWRLGLGLLGLSLIAYLTGVVLPPVADAILAGVGALWAGAWWARARRGRVAA